jgi:hypothetical protein
MSSRELDVSCSAAAGVSATRPRSWLDGFDLDDADRPVSCTVSISASTNGSGVGLSVIRNHGPRWVTPVGLANV